MSFEYDPDKDLTNIAKHGVSLRLGITIYERRLGISVDGRRDYGEKRANAYGMVNGRLHVCTFTMRGSVCRIISVRKASRQEQREWLMLD